MTDIDEERPYHPQRRDWDCAHGIVSILKTTFVRHGGFEGWRCGADSESLKRWTKGGLTMYVPREKTALVRKHSEGLTKSEETGYGSEIRRAYKQEIIQRSVNPVRQDKIAIADCALIERGTDIEQAEIPQHPMAVNRDEVMERMYSGGDDIEAETDLLAEAYYAIDLLLRTHKKGYQKKQRQAWEYAERVLNNK
jgi:hypothetical protein